MKKYTKKDMVAQINGKLQRNFGRDASEATSAQIFQACALILRDVMIERHRATVEQIMDQHQRRVHYLSMEFLMGRSLRKNAYNLGVEKALTEAIEALGFSAADVFEEEPDAGLGNGGLGRLAACYMDAATTLEIPITGYSICYELGIFKQKIIDGRQEELPDNWLELGSSWLLSQMDKTEEVRFGGKVENKWNPDGSLSVVHTGYSSVLAVPRDMQIAGYGTKMGNVLRLWEAKSP